MNDIYNAMERLRSIKQRAKQPLHEYRYEPMFDRALERLKAIYPDIPEKQVINIYMNSLLYDIFNRQVQYLNEIENDETIYPTTLIQAKLMTRKVYYSNT
jgi:hypothetical protein